MKKSKCSTRKKNVKVYANGGVGDFIGNAADVAQSNAGTIGSTYGTIVGGIAGSVVPGLGTAVGAGIGGAIGGGIGKVVQGRYENKQAEADMSGDQNDIDRKAALTNYMNQQRSAPNYGANFANGGDGNEVFGRELSNQDYQAFTSPAAMQSRSTELQANIPPQYPTRQPMGNMSSMSGVGNIPLSYTQPELGKVDTNAPGLRTPARDRLRARLIDDRYEGVSTRVPRPGENVDRMEALRRQQAVVAEESNRQNNAYLAGVQKFQQDNPQIQGIQTIYTNPRHDQIQKFDQNNPQHAEEVAIGDRWMRDHPEDFTTNSINGSPVKANGGYMEETRNLDNVTMYGNGGTHAQNKYGGIPVGRKAKVEQGEIRHGNFIFSNKF